MRPNGDSAQRDIATISAGGASDTSSPPCLLRSLPAGAVAGWGLHPLEKRRLVTAHVESRPSHLRRFVQLLTHLRQARSGTARIWRGLEPRSTAYTPENQS